MFFCRACNCELKNIRTLKDHVKGAKHIKKALEYKRSVLGTPKAPQNAPRQKEKKKERPVVDIGLSLEERLQEDGPAIGLEYITEFLNGQDPRDHPMYTCSLAGCKSAWGTSDDMFHHVLNSKHQRNYLQLLEPEDTRIAGLTKELVLQRAIQCEEERKGRDYSVIRVEKRTEEYWRLRERPDSWSEKKAELGLIGAAGNSNYEPLDKKRRNVEDSQFSEDTGGWRPPTRRSAEENVERNLSRAIAGLRDSVELFTAGKDSQEARTILTQFKTLQILSDLVGPGVAHHQKASSEFRALREELEEKLEAEIGP